MILYAVDQGKTYFSEDFRQIFCTFSYITTGTKVIGDEVENFGMFIADVNWDGFFTDPILARYQKVALGESWLDSLDPDPAVFNDLFYNKLCEYLVVARGKFGMAIEVEDEDLVEIDADTNEDDLYTEIEELAIFEDMFNSSVFIEAFKDELDDPAKPTLLSAIAYFQKNELVVRESNAKRFKFRKFL
jgi:hypothetical protein